MNIHIPIAFVIEKRRNLDYPEYEIWMIRCPWCGHVHEHGGLEGHRLSHCGDRHPDNPGYYITDKPICGDCKRRFPEVVA